MNGSKKIAIYGTFDVDNYGDLLFPHIAKYRLEDFKIEVVSPTRRKTIFNDEMHKISFKESVKRKYDAVLIGGGNILHLKHNNFTVYKENGFNYADLWLGAINIAAKNKCPSIINAPSIPYFFYDYIEKKLSKRAFKYCSYISLRENYSKKIVESLNNKNIDIKVVPDTAFDISRLWPYKGDKKKVMTINLNERYHGDIEQTTYWIEEIYKVLNLSLVFIVIGDCHGDLEFTKKVCNNLKIDYKITNSNNLKEIAHSIAGSELFIGSSMHGFITALSFDVPSFLVLNDKPIHKFLGLLEICELEKNSLCSSFKECFENIEKPANLNERMKLKIQSDLDNHWVKISNLINSDYKTQSNLFLRNYIFLLNNSKKISSILKILKKLKKRVS